MELFVALQWSVYHQKYSYLEASLREAGAAAELEVSNKVVKYAGFSSQGEFVPTADEFHGPINRDSLQFFSKLGRRLPGMFEHLCCYSVWCNVLIRFCCTMDFFDNSQPEQVAIAKNLYFFV